MKHYLLLLFLIGCIGHSNAQEKTISNTKENKANSSEIVEGETISFPIKATKTTDPNYEVNKQKSLETQKKLDAQPNTIIKDDAYYLSQIAEYKKRIKEIEDELISPSVNPDKLETLKDELAKIELEYNNYKTSK